MNVELKFKIGHRGKVIFNLSDWWPFSLLRERSKELFIMCHRKMRFNSEAHAKNTAWTKDWNAKEAYHCTECGKWHLTKLLQQEGRRRVPKF